MFLTLLLACNQAAAPPASPPPQDETSTSVASALSALQSGQIPEPAPREQGPPAVPEEATARIPTAKPTASGGRADTPECAAARQAREDHEAAIDRYRTEDVAAAEQRYVDAETAFNWCLSDVGGCAVDGERIKDYQTAMAVAERGMSDANFHVGELEAELYKLDKDIAAACGTGRN